MVELDNNNLFIGLLKIIIIYLLDFFRDRMMNSVRHLALNIFS
jgi:hypothetical protein